MQTLEKYCLSATLDFSQFKTQQKNEIFGQNQMSNEIPNLEKVSVF